MRDAAAQPLAHARVVAHVRAGRALAGGDRGQRAGARDLARERDAARRARRGRPPRPGTRGRSAASRAGRPSAASRCRGSRRRRAIKSSAMPRRSGIATPGSGTGPGIGPCWRSGAGRSSRVRVNAIVSAPVEANGPRPSRCHSAMFSGVASSHGCACAACSTRAWPAGGPAAPGRRAGESTSGSIPCSRRCSAGPTPESISSCGVLIAPPQRTTSRARASRSAAVGDADRAAVLDQHVRRRARRSRSRGCRGRRRAAGRRRRPTSAGRRAA